MRADAARNRGRLLEAAAAAFAEQGLEVPVAEVARRAGVGPGTLFRHFPTKDDLIAAIIEERIASLLAIADEGLADDDPWAGLERFLRGGAGMHAADRGLMNAIKHRALGNPCLDSCRADLLGRVTALVERAQRAGVLREDFAGPDVPVLLSAIGGSGDGWERYLGIVLDGLRVNTSAGAPASARRRSSGSSRAKPARSAPA